MAFLLGMYFSAFGQSDTMKMFNIMGQLPAGQYNQQTMQRGLSLEFSALQMKKTNFSN